ncbi:MAG: hypothetical protein ABI665_20235 [Vicinamibacterales bacterium]
MGERENIVMAVRKPVRRKLSKALKPLSKKAVDQQVMKLADFDREAVRNEIAHLRDVTAQLLDRFGRVPVTTTKAPGKRHRKPPPQERIDKRMGEVVGKKMGKKSVKHAMLGRG